MEVIALSDLQRFSLTKFRDVDGFVTSCWIFFLNWIYFVHVSSFWNLKSWIFPCLYGLTVLAPSFSHESHWMWYRPRACKGLPKRIGGRRESKWKSIEILTVDLSYHLMDFWSLMNLWWFVSFFLSTFDVFVQGNNPTTLSPGGLKKFHEVMCL